MVDFDNNFAGMSSWFEKLPGITPPKVGPGGESPTTVQEDRTPGYKGYITEGEHAGMFKVVNDDGQVEYMTRDDLFMYACLKVQKANQDEVDKVEKKVKELSEKAEHLSKLIQLMQECRAHKDRDHDDEGDYFKLPGLDSEDQYYNKSKDIEGWFSALGLGSPQDVNPNDKTDEWRNEWDMNIQKAQGELDLINNQISQEMTSYDKYNNKVEKAMDLVKSGLDQSSQSNQGVISNW